MSRKANPALIGFFVLGSIVLAVVSIAFFGSMKFFSESEDFIVYFDEAVSGLDVGAPVKFRGVPIGSVKEVYIRFNQGDESDHIPVIIELDITLLNSSLGVDVDIRDEEVFFQVINQGYRAQLVMESFITGLLYIEIDIDLDAGRPVMVQEEAIYKEFPSKQSLTAALGSTAQEVFAMLGALDVQTINNELVGVLSKANKALGAIEFSRINDSVIRAADSATELVSSEKIKTTLDNLNKALKEYEKLASDLRGKIDPVLAEADKTNIEIQTTLQKVRDVSTQIERTLSPESSIRYELENTLSELAELSESLRLFVEYLERNPRAFLTGKELPDSDSKKKKKKK